jgi:mono/diheme cytochrome c family protein
MAFFAFLAMSCGGTSGVSSNRTATIVALKGQSANGAALYLSQCEICHGAVGKGTSSGPSLVSAVSRPTAFVERVLTGKESMKAYSNVFTDQEVADIFEWAKATVR